MENLDDLSLKITEITTMPADFRTLVITMVCTGDAKVYNVYAYKVTLSQFVSVWTTDIMKKNTVAVHSYRNLKYKYTLINGYLSTFRLINVDKDFSTRYANMQAQVAIILAGIKSTMSTLEKILYVHDYLAYNAEYDYVNSLNGTVPSDSYLSYGILVKKIGVCEGYSLAFLMIMNVLGIPAAVIVSTAMDHSWNAVLIDKIYYYVDLTWDDPSPSIKGRVNHNYFIKNDAEFKSGDFVHFGWKDYRCSSTKYSNWFMGKVNGRLLYQNLFWIYIDDTNAVVKSKIDGTGKISIIGNEEGDIYAFVPYSNMLLYTDGMNILSCNMDGTNKQCLFTVTNTDELGPIKYLYIGNDDKLVYTTETFVIDTNGEKQRITKEQAYILS